MSTVRWPNVNLLCIPLSATEYIVNRYFGADLKPAAQTVFSENFRAFINLLTVLAVSLCIYMAYTPVIPPY